MTDKGLGGQTYSFLKFCVFSTLNEDASFYNHPEIQTVQHRHLT